MSIAMNQLEKIAVCHVIRNMQPVTETRLLRLQMLVKKHNGSLADLNEAIGLVRTDATLSQIRTKAPHSKTGKPRVMGDDLARKIEERLSLPTGWMDTPPSYAELADKTDTVRELFMVMQTMNTQDLYQAKAVLLALKSSSTSTAFTAAKEVDVETTAATFKPAPPRLNGKNRKVFRAKKPTKNPQSEAERLRLLRKKLRESLNASRFKDSSKIIAKSDGNRNQI